MVFDRIYATVANRRHYTGDKPSYVARLFARGNNKIIQKVGEEAVELVLASAQGNKQEMIAETTDLLFHIMILLVAHDITLDDIATEFTRREGVSGVEEKASRG